MPRKLKDIEFVFVPHEYDDPLQPKRSRGPGQYVTPTGYITLTRFGKYDVPIGRKGLKARLPVLGYPCSGPGEVRAIADHYKKLLDKAVKESQKCFKKHEHEHQESAEKLRLLHNFVCLTHGIFPPTDHLSPCVREMIKEDKNRWKAWQEDAVSSA
jgi:hypothetical protein